MSEQIELRACEHCSKETPLEAMQMMEDYWVCGQCINEFKEAFDACKHKWSSHISTMGDHGRYCKKCSGFVDDENFAKLFGCDAVAVP